MDRNSTLEPEDWQDFRKLAHDALDNAISHLETRGNLPVWQRVPDDIRASLGAELPIMGSDIASLNQRIVRDFLPYDIGNTHPRFFGWVHGSGTVQGLIPDIFTAAMNANLGGRDHLANEVEKQVIDWCRCVFGLPDTAGGLVVSGTSMATLIALKTALNKCGGTELRDQGLAAMEKPLVGYASAEAHSCIARSFDILGLGKNALRPIPVDADFRMDPKALEAAIIGDLANGITPFCIIATAGSVNVGSIDPLNALAEIAEKHCLWLHVDGAFGALAVLSNPLKPLLAGIEKADSLAFDFHKWMHVNYDAGMVLVRNAEDQRQAFSERPDYLGAANRGLAAGNPWFCEYGPELSRGFRALKIWYQMAHFGLERIGAQIAQNCLQAQHLATRVAAEIELEGLAPTALNITCFRFNPGGLDETRLDRINGEIVIRLQETGVAAPSTTKIDGRLAIRVNITNHRTQFADLDLLADTVLALGRELV
ncbi:MAG: cytochrome D ubiquinol oxidase subunit I [Rhodobacteraceae bacterium]|nr:cytochrome D ubiquinol oxidase subunit I [Paracoccaceae bacterium]